MRWSDYALLILFCLVLCGFPLLDNRTLTTHETVHCQNVREMRADGDWIIPHYGGRVWMERPPLPFWVSIGVLELFGDRPLSYRLAALFVGIPIVLMIGWIAGVWYGRGIGLASGLILATMQEFTHYATGPEADIFLCAIVTAAIALFVHLEFRSMPPSPPVLRGRGVGGEGVRSIAETPPPHPQPLSPEAGERGEQCTSFAGRRPWPLLAFFVVLGLTNVAKGLFFGTIFVLLPVGCFLLSNRNWSALLGTRSRQTSGAVADARTLASSATSIRRYVWLWGWLAFAAVGAAWPLAACLYYPDVVDFWKHDYLGRLNQGYMQEPFWYYFVHLPVVVFPWSLPALYGLWLSRVPAFRERATPERFLWCWAVAPILFFSIPQGKHHHYLLQCMAPWAVLGALGAVRLWERIAAGPAWLHRPWLSLLVLGVPGDAALLVLGSRLPTPTGLVPVLLVAWPACAYALWWAVIQKNGRIALGTCCVLFTALYWAGYGYRTRCWDRYGDDMTFVRQACATVPADQPVLVMDDDAPLNASWLLFYVGERAALLHNVTFLLDEKIKSPEVYLIARRKVKAALANLGTCDVLLESKRSRYEETPADRYTLYRVRLRDHVTRQSTVRISPLQATGRAAGPYLCEQSPETPPWPTP